MKTFYLVLSFVVCFTVNLSAAEKIIIDSDIGEDIDDLITSAFALASPEFEVLAITTVDGNVAAPQPGGAQALPGDG